MATKSMILWCPSAIGNDLTSIRILFDHRFSAGCRTPLRVQYALRDTVDDRAA